MFPWDKKASGMKKVSRRKKSLGQKCINSFLALSYLTIAGYGFFLGAYGSLPNAAIWWCLRTGGGGVLGVPLALRAHSRTMMVAQRVVD